MAEQYDDHSARSPSPDVLGALRREWTPQALRNVLLYAKQRARMVRQTGRACPPQKEYARELVHDAHADTWSGELVWDPSRCSLVMHLCAAIKARTWREIQRAARFTSMDEPPATNDDGLTEAEPDDPRERFSSSPDAAGPAVVFPALIARVCDALRNEARGDPPFLAILGAWERGFTDRDEIMEITGLDKSAYDRVRKRIVYVAARLSLELRQLVRDYLSSQS